MWLHLGIPRQDRAKAQRIPATVSSIDSYTSSGVVHTILVWSGTSVYLCAAGALELLRGLNDNDHARDVPRPTG